MFVNFILLAFGQMSLTRLILMILFLGLPSGVHAVTAKKINLTLGNNRSTVDREFTYNLGPTGMRGWIDNGWPETPAQDGYTAFAPYQILVTEVAPALRRQESWP